MDEIRNVVGDTISEKHLVETIMKHKFDCAKALDVILNNSTDASTNATAATSSSSSSASTLTQPPQSAQPMETGNHKMFGNFLVLLFVKHTCNLRLLLLFFFSYDVSFSMLLWLTICVVSYKTLFYRGSSLACSIKNFGKGKIRNHYH